MSTIIGFHGRDAAARAHRASSRATASPQIRELPDGSVVGVGDVIDRNGRPDVHLYGAHGSHCWASELSDLDEAERIAAASEDLAELFAQSTPTDMTAVIIPDGGETWTVAS